MNSEAILNAIGNINDELIENAIKPKRRYKITGVVAACLCVLLILPFLFSPEEPESMGGAPSIKVGEYTYIISPYSSVSEDIPEGFVYGGKGEIDGTEYEYYISKDDPYRVYVYNEVRTNGEIDENGTLIETEPHYAYSRYVRSDLRGKELVMVNGRLYASVWSYNTDTEYPPRTETLLKGFEYCGTAAFCGYDTLPVKELTCNTQEAQIYTSKAEPDIVLVSTEWYTATEEENGETLHKGYNIYIPFSLGGTK